MFSVAQEARMAAPAPLRVRSVTIEGRLYEVRHGPDRGEWLVSRDGAHVAFVRRDEDGAWMGNDLAGWVDQALIDRIMREAR
jgi:hypothetical protein